MDKFWNLLGDLSTVTAIIALLIGGIFSILKEQLVSKKDFKNDVGLLKEKYLEKLNCSLKKILSPLYTTDLESDTEKTVNDYSIEFVKNIISISKKIFFIEKLYTDLLLFYRLIFYSIIIGIVLVLVSFLFVEARQYVSMLSVFLIISQVILLIMVKRCEKELEEYENNFE